MNESKDINTMKDRTCCYFDDVININIFDLDEISLNQKSYKKSLIYHLKYIVMYCF